MFDKKLAIEKKNFIQGNLVKLSGKCNNVIVSWATGCGKTLAGLKIVHNDYKKNPNIKGYIICKEHSHVDNWEKDIIEHGMEFINDISEKFLYASVKKYTEPVDFIIMDECHAITRKRLEHLKKMVTPSTRVILLSATINGPKRDLIRHLIIGKLFESTITITRAIQEGLLPIPTVYIHHYQLREGERKEMFSLTRGYQNKAVNLECVPSEVDSLIAKHKNVDIDVICNEKEKYELITNELEQAKYNYFNNKEEYAKNKWVNLGSLRKRYLANTKTEWATEILLGFKGSNHRYICFTGSKDQAEFLGGNDWVHSSLPKEEVLRRKDEFNSGKRNKLIVVNMFRESLNLVNVQKGLTVQVDDVKLSFIQMLGRVFRSDFPEMHIMCIDDTQDEVYVHNIMSDFNPDYVKHIYH